MVCAKEDWDEGKPYYAGGVHCEPDIPATSELIVNQPTMVSSFLKTLQTPNLTTMVTFDMNLFLP